MQVLAFPTSLPKFRNTPKGEGEASFNWLVPCWGKGEEDCRKQMQKTHTHLP